MSDKITWEETIKYIRSQPEYQKLVETAYFEENLPLNVERFRKGEEFVETLNILREYQPQAETILDIGSGNGISAVSLTLAGYDVTAVEPDPSDTIGAGAIKKLKAHYHLEKLKVYEDFAEEIKFPNTSFDVVYTRQCMHHAYDLPKFISEAARVLKRGGLMLTVRDHVVYNEQDKEWFLASHPLHKYYGGENAFSYEEYENAMTSAGLEILKVFKYYDSVINYFPLTKNRRQSMVAEEEKKIKQRLRITFGAIGRLKITEMLYKKFRFDSKEIVDESNVPGRMYTYICRKK